MNSQFRIAILLGLEQIDKLADFLLGLGISMSGGKRGRILKLPVVSPRPLALLQTADNGVWVTLKINENKQNDAIYLRIEPSVPDSRISVVPADAKLMHFDLLEQIAHD